MLGPVKMFRGMLVLRRLTASDMAANHAESKMHPSIAHLQAFLTTIRVRLYILDLI